MPGKYSGVVSSLNQKYQNLSARHCLHHRVELSVSDIIKDIHGINHFRAFMEKIFSLHSQPHKHSGVLKITCHLLGYNLF
jgi:hypothetical protein